MPLTNAKKQQIIRALGIRCPVRRWQQHRDGSVTVHTRNGTQTWKTRARTKAKKSGDTEA
jgi:hypothetical protein